LTKKNKNHDTYFVPGLFRGLRVLEILAEAQQPMSISEIGRQMELSRSSVFRLVYTLKQLGFTEDAEGGRSITLGARVLNLGFSYLASQPLIQTARLVLEKLRDETGVSCHLAILESADVLFLDCVQSRLGYLSNVNVGHRVPAYASPLGWHLLADHSDAAIQRMFLEENMHAFTDKTPRTPKELCKFVRKAAQDCSVVSYGIAETGGRSVSAPVMGADGRVVAAIDISGPESVFIETDFESVYVPAVLKAAAQISIRLGSPAHNEVRTRFM
jgi:DNA-binding IclR family transcriptional regulator